jgi:hypothetical protein
MANVVFGGFRPIRTLSGSVLPSPIYKEVANNYGTPIRTYDVVAVTTDGTIIIGAAAANGALVGTCDGVSYINASGVRTGGRYLPKNTTFSPTTVGSQNASIVTFTPCTPDVVFRVQADEGTTFATIATQISALMENADIADATATTNQDYSSQCLDISTHATTTANFRILNISGYSAGGLKLGLNDPTVTRFEFQVVCSESAYTTGTATGV